MARHYLVVVTLVILGLGSLVRSQCDGLNNPIAPALDGPLPTTNLVTFDDLVYPPYGIWASGSTGSFQVSTKVGQSIILTGDSQGGTGNYAFLWQNPTNDGTVQWDNAHFWSGSTTEKPGFYLLTWKYHWSQLQFDPPVSAVVVRANTNSDPVYLGVIKILDVNGNLIECRNIPSVAGINTYTTLGFSSALPIKYVRFENVRTDVLVDNIQYLTCASGYMYVGSACIDIDECTLFNSTCGDHGTCTNTIGSFSCICDQGYEKNNNGVCVDTNECLSDVCGEHFVCTNTDGSYSCACDNGYNFNDQTNACDDINECLSGACGDHSTCTNTEGSYYCVCDNGYELNNQTMTCHDINECLSGACGDHATCTNTEGSYSCTCDNGYELNNETITCNDIDECLSGACGDHSTCTNTDGFYSCTCNSGYELNNETITCDDINECLSDVCGYHATCENTDGSYTCTCNDGYELNNDTMTCEDINECLSGACGDHATCTNTDGSYSCTCDNGYEFNNQTMTCEDINECTTLSLCSSFANCTNTDGSFTCLCGEGYTGDGRGKNGCTVVQVPVNSNTPSSGNSPSVNQPSTSPSSDNQPSSNNQPSSDPSQPSSPTDAPAEAGQSPSTDAISSASIYATINYIVIALSFTLLQHRCG